MKWTRAAEGSYEANDGWRYFAIYRDPTVAGNWSGPSWRLELDYRGLGTFRTYREAKAAAEIAARKYRPFAPDSAPSPTWGEG